MGETMWIPYGHAIAIANMGEAPCTILQVPFGNGEILGKEKLNAREKRLIKECYQKFFESSDRSWNKKKKPFSDWLNVVLAEVADDG